MSLTRWFRRNNRKIMAIVIVILMIGFVAGAWLRQLGKRRRGLGETLAVYNDGKEITREDSIIASRELETLKFLRAELMLRNIPMPAMRAPDLRALLIAELLFSDTTTSAQIAQFLQRIAVTNNIAISAEQINNFYEKRYPPHIYWILLNHEAHQAGIRIKREDAAKQLANVVPQLFEQSSFEQVMQNVTRMQNISQEQVIDTFAKLMRIITYNRMVCTGESFTETEIRVDTKLRNAKVSGQFAAVPAELFLDEQPEPSQEAIEQQFEEYKDVLPDVVTEDNPYGFGYKLPEMVAFEYIAVKRDDILETVELPTSEEMENFYQRNRNMFTEQVPTDPNDPNSPKEQRLKSYSSVMSQIRRRITENRITDKADKVMEQAKTLTEVGLEQSDKSVEMLTGEDYRKLSGDYKMAAQELTEKFGLPVLSGKTGMLGVADVMEDANLGRMFMRGSAGTPVYMSQILFSAGELDLSDLGPFDIQPPELYKNIGPLKDMGNRLFMLARVTKTQKQKMPTLDTVISKNALRLEETAEEKIYSVKEDVTEDLKKVAALENMQPKVDEFVKMVEDANSFEAAVEKFNSEYAKDDLKVTVRDRQRIRLFTPEDMLVYEIQSEGTPQGRATGAYKKRALLNEKLMSLIPRGKQEPNELPLSFVFKPEQSYYVVNTLSADEFFFEDYEMNKPMTLYLEAGRKAQSLAMVHLTSDNIVERNNFSFVEEETELSEPNEPNEVIE